MYGLLFESLDLWVWFHWIGFGYYEIRFSAEAMIIFRHGVVWIVRIFSASQTVYHYASLKSIRFLYWTIFNPVTHASSCLQKVNDKLQSLERKFFGEGIPVRVVVVGCGYSGVELAATVSERLKDKGTVQAINVESTICPSAPPGNREAALKVRILLSTPWCLRLWCYVICWSFDILPPCQIKCNNSLDTGS